MVSTYGDLLRQTKTTLRKAGNESADWLAMELLSHASGKSPAAILADRDIYASDCVTDRLQDALERTCREEPLAYILGSWSFYGLDLLVTPDVLIPRDDTMAVTDLALEALRCLPAPQRVLDLCTGSGCIGLALAQFCETARLTLGDISAPALAIAKQNAANLKLTGRVSCLSFDALQQPPAFIGTYDLIVSNPPYVTSDEMKTLESSVRDYEPSLALDGGDDGLMFYRAIAAQYRSVLRDGGFLCLEFGMGQEEDVGQILRENGFEEVEFRRDSRDVIRAVRAKKCADYKTNV